jgi:cephalosporin hydroxylase
MKEHGAYSQAIPDNEKFVNERDFWRKEMGESVSVRRKAIELTVASNKFLYGYQWEWCGVPIIRHPDDIVLQQEIMWALRPKFVVETGIARGGSLVLSSSLIGLYYNQGKVLGLDIQILPHTLKSLQPWVANGRIELFECDSSSEAAGIRVAKHIGADQGPMLLVLDSNHSHAHVLAELKRFAPLLPRESIIMVADTIIQEMPESYYSNRPWGVQNNPLTAVEEFLSINSDFELDTRWARRSLMGECRDGILVKK